MNTITTSSITTTTPPTNTTQPSVGPINSPSNTTTTSPTNTTTTTPTTKTIANTSATNTITTSPANTTSTSTSPTNTITTSPANTTSTSTSPTNTITTSPANTTSTSTSPTNTITTSPANTTSTSTSPTNTITTSPANTTSTSPTNTTITSPTKTTTISHTNTTTTSPTNTTTTSPTNTTITSPTNTTITSPTNTSPTNTTITSPTKTTTISHTNTTTTSPTNTTTSPTNTTITSPTNTTITSPTNTSPTNTTITSPTKTTTISHTNTTTTSPTNTTTSPTNTTITSPTNTNTTITSPTNTSPTNTTITTTLPTNTTITSPTNTTITSPTNTTTISHTNTTTTTTTSPTNTTTTSPTNTTTISPTNTTTSKVDQLVSQLEGLLVGPNISVALGNISVHIVSNLLGASPNTLTSSSNQIVRIVDTVGLKLVFETDVEELLSDSLALSIKAVDGANFKETTFSIADPENILVRNKYRYQTEVQGSIRLPSSLTQTLSSAQQSQASRVQFNFYQKGTVFQDPNLGTRRLISGILGASVANLSIAGLQENVTVNLRNTEPIPGNYVAICVYWDFTMNNGRGGWNSDGCFLQNTTDNETTCSCNHLTSFAILLDLARGPITDRLQANILTFITYIGCGLSSIFLSLTLLTYLAFEKLRKDMPSKILIQLCLALLMLNLVFLVDAWLSLYPQVPGLCISTAWFLHYFLLASFTWMGLEAVHMYLALVKVFNTYVSRYMLKFSLVGWGVPMVVVVIVIAVDPRNYGLVTYGKFTDGTSDDFCWLRSDIVFYVAVVAYFCVIFLFNFIMFVVVMVQLRRILRQNPHSTQHRSTLQDARRVAGVTVLLGLTWGFAFFAWGPVSLAFMYLFTIFNSLQGFFIFLFHCLVKDNVRRQWRTYLCCGKLRLAENSDWSRTATQKIMKKSSVSGVTSLSSSQSNSSSFLAR
ncbi:unnamed protein product [Lota lota]